MSDEKDPRDLQNDLVVEVMQVLDKFKPGGDHGPIKDRKEWERLVESKLRENRDLLAELTHFADLWKYFKDRNEKLGAEIVGALGEVHHFPVTERIARMRDINLKLMERVSNASQSAQLRN